MPKSNAQRASGPVATMLSRIVAVEPEPESKTVVATFANGERRRFDVGPLMSRGVFRRLTSSVEFAAVRVEKMGGIEWESAPDLSRDTIYVDGQPV